MSEVICDSSSLISLGNSCALGVIPYLKEEHGVKFYIPSAVKREIVDNPLKTKKFKLTALKMRKLIEKEHLKLIESEAINDHVERFLDLCNSVLVTRGNGSPIQVIHRGEAETVSLLKHTGAKALSIDERTTRLLIEDVNMLRDYMSARSEQGIDIDEGVRDKLSIETQDINVLRSSELLARAFESGYFEEKSKDLLEGSLYGLKFAGCAIKNEEIEEYLDLIG